MRFDLCQKSLEDLKHDNFLDMNKFVVATNHKDMIHLVCFFGIDLRFYSKLSL